VAEKTLAGKKVANLAAGNVDRVELEEASSEKMIELLRRRWCRPAPAAS
jgi:hypothetical protein